MTFGLCYLQRSRGRYDRNLRKPNHHHQRSLFYGSHPIIKNISGRSRRSLHHSVQRTYVISSAILKLVTAGRRERRRRGGSRGSGTYGGRRPPPPPDKLGYLQGWRIRGFEGARAPPELEGAPSHCQKHPLKTKEIGP